MDYKRKKPTVFISSTCNDLSQQREDLKEFFENSYNFNTMLSEFNSFPVDPCIGTFENCLINVDKYADIFILIIDTRYGYITEQGKSITNLEYLHAKSKNIPIFIFISKQLDNALSFWRKNPNGDFSGVTDNIKLFEFVSEIYHNNQWVYTFNSVNDIKKTMQNQLALIFSDGLTYRKLISSPQYDILNSDLPSGAVRALTEKPYAWQYKFFAYVLKDEFDKLKTTKWDLEYGIYEGYTSNKDGTELLNYISEKFNEIVGIEDNLNTLLNTVANDALGENETCCNIEMTIYVSKRIALIYKKLANWALYFKAIIADKMFSKILDLLYLFPKSFVLELERYVNELFNSLISVPDDDDGINRNIDLIFKPKIRYTTEIIAEMKHLSTKLLGL